MTADVTKKRPIIFKAEMVRAILNGHKTQTRRVFKPQPDRDGKVDVGEIGTSDGVAYVRGARGGHCTRVPCPYGKSGDQLWVRECWGVDNIGALPILQIDALRFRATDSMQSTPDIGWRPSIHMPRWASRITLEITGVRVEKLQDIGEDDAAAEGVSERFSPPDHVMSIGRIAAFHDLWDSINLQRGYAWNTNPWVWVVEFKRITP